MKLSRNLSVGFFFIFNQFLVSQSIENPNILFIIVDDLNDYIGVLNGHKQAKTPNIDKLANEATNFKNAHANVPVCQPSRNSLFTGILPHRSKDFGWTPHFKQPHLKNKTTFIELLKQNNYETYGTGKILHANKRNYWSEWGIEEKYNYGPHASNISQDGIDGHPLVPEPFKSVNIVDGSFSPLSNIPYVLDSLGNRIEIGWRYNKKEKFNYVDEIERDLMPDEMHAEWICNKLTELNKINNKNPFFMAVGFVKPHTPLYAPKKYFDMYPLENIILPEIKEDDIEDTHYTKNYPKSTMGLHYYEKLIESYRGNKGLRQFLRAYLACISFVDDLVGKMLNGLEKNNFSKNTIVILTSDHGWQMGQKNYLYKNSPWEESTKIPLIIKIPGSMPSVVLEPVSLIDIFPTIIEMCNLKFETNKKANRRKVNSLDGNSLLELIKKPSSKRWAGSSGALTMLGVGINKTTAGIGVNKNKSAPWHIEIEQQLDDSLIKKQNYSLRNRDFRYILYKDGNEELYDHQIDTHEWNNLSENHDYRKIKKKMKRDLLKKIN
ncbi:MAG: sulfatase [Bacteroidota bacterium]|nr:sulfatase [Bacteroidota bacterium]